MNKILETMLKVSELPNRYWDEYKRIESTMSARQFKLLCAQGKIWQYHDASDEGYLLSRWAYRVSPNFFKIAFVEYADCPRLPPGNALQSFLICALTESYCWSGKMCLEFCGPEEGKEPTLETGFLKAIPDAIHALAQRTGIVLPKGRVVPDDVGRNLYINISGLSDLQNSKRIDPFRATLFRYRELVKYCRRRFLKSPIAKRGPLQKRPSQEQTVFNEPAFNDPAVLRYLLLRERLELVLRELDGNPVRALTGLGTSDDLTTSTYTISDTIEFVPDIGDVLVCPAESEISIHSFSLPVSALETELNRYLSDVLGRPPSQVTSILVFHSDIRAISASIWSALSEFCRCYHTSCLFLKDSYSEFEREVNSHLDWLSNVDYVRNDVHRSR